MLTPPFTVDQFLGVVGETFSLPENEVREHDRPRASSLGACARQQAYMMAGVEPDPVGVEGSARQTDQELTAEQGRMFEELSVRVIERLGLHVVDRQIALPDDYPVSGHPDGRLDKWGTGWPAIDAWQAAGEPDRRVLDDGLVWGFEHKHLGRYAYEDGLKKGFEAAHNGYVLQSALYGDALGWDASLFVVVAQDSSAVRGDLTANLRAKNPAVRWSVQPGIHPKLTLATLDIRPLKNGLVPVAHQRAKWLSNWKRTNGYPKDVAREFDPTITEEKWVPDGEGDRKLVDVAPFPCGYCPFLSFCLEDGPGGKSAPRLPWTESVEADD